MEGYELTRKGELRLSVLYTPFLRGDKPRPRLSNKEKLDLYILMSIDNQGYLTGKATPRKATALRHLVEQEYIDPIGPIKFYHATTRGRLPGILDSGLSPKYSRSGLGKGLPDTDPTVCLEYVGKRGSAWVRQFRDVLGKSEPTVVLEVDLPEGTRSGWDPECPSSLVVRETIPPSHIRVLSKEEEERLLGPG